MSLSKYEWIVIAHLNIQKERFIAHKNHPWFFRKDQG
jgi:hypothetical protein